MPYGLRLLTGFCVFEPILALGFYVRDDPQVHVGLSEVSLIAICCAVFVYGFMQAARWSRPLVMLCLVGTLILAIFQNHAGYSLADSLGRLFAIGLIAWVLYFRHDVRDYYAGAHKTVA